MIHDMNKAMRTAMTFALALGLMSDAAFAQDELWILNEGRFDWTTGEVVEAPSLGSISMETLTYQELLVFEGEAFATDLEISGDVAVVVLENRVVKVDMNSGQIIADTDLLGAQEAALLADGTVVVTRGGVDPITYEPLPLSSYLVWLDGEDLGIEGELFPFEGPSLPSQEVFVMEGVVYVGVNNGWQWGQEVGRLGRWSPLEGTYEEFDLGAGAENPVAIHALAGDLYTVNNGDWSSTSVSRISTADLATVETSLLSNVTAGCNASAFVGDKLALQISGETGLRLMDGPSMQWEDEPLNVGNSAAYSLAVHPGYGWVCSGVTDFESMGEVQIHTSTGEWVATIPVAIAPGNLVWRIQSTSNVDVICPLEQSAEGEWDLGGRCVNQLAPGIPTLRLERLENGEVNKVIQWNH